MDSDREPFVFYVNGRKVIDKTVEPEWTLLYYLRNKLRLCGTKLGCGEGGCGACTVMVSKYDRSQKKILHFSVNACLAPICSMHGLAVTTVEGIGSTKTGLHPVQERMAGSHGSQCGFCTPGIVMSMYTLLRNNPQPNMHQVESAFEGNLCRCTGYRPILEGYKTFTKEFSCPQGENCCRNQNARVSPGNTADEGLVKSEEFSAYDPSQERIFPNELQLTDTYDKQNLEFQGERVTWYRPINLETFLKLKAQFPNCRIVTGNTEIGVEVKFKNCHYPEILSPTHVPELNMVEHVSSGIRFGAAVTLNRIDSVLKQAVRDMPEHQTRIFAGIVEMLRWFAGQQIRNVSAVGGNIVTASPISDLNPLFMAANCKLQLAKTGKMREVTIDHTFFTGYRKTILEPDEILLNITVPYTQEDEYFYGYKQAHRREDDISIVNAGCRVVFEPGSTVINRLYLAYGGMAPTTVMALKSMNEAVGKEWNEDLLATMSDSLCEDLPLPPGVPGGSVQYRRTLTLSFFFKFYLSVKQQLHMKKLSPSILPDYESATPVFKKHEFKSSQYYGIVSKEQSITDGVGRPIHHMSAAKQATGEARYIDDIPPFKDELYLALVTSSKAHAEIVNVDTQAALSLPGVHAYIDHNDVMGSNNVGVVLPDELIFAEKKVTCQGQAIGAIVADNQLIAQRAAKLVTVQYKVLKPIISIKDAIAEESYYEPINSFDSGDVDEALMNADHVIDGEMYVGGQEHFYLETHASIAVPTGEDGEMELFSSSQSPTTLQILTASALGVSASRINVRVKRLGGGFGGKESRFIVVALPVAIAAARLNRPVRCMLDRDEDMAITGTRHPYYAKYKVAYSSNGKIEALDIKMYMNAGNSLDLSAGVMERALFHLDNCYKIPKLRAYGYICKTNIPSNTAFRGFGGPQALMVCEAWITQIAERLNLPVHQIRELNFYDKGDITHTCTSMDDSYLQVKRCWTQCLEQSGYLQQKDHIAQFNRENRWKKRGISIIPTKFGIAFTVTFLNQAGALVHVYRDGSVLIAHGGTEMGQGLHTKMIQVASRALNISMNKIHITETSTSTVPNTSPTAASASSDLNGMALVNACSVIMERLKPYIKSKPDKTWDDWVSDAYFDRVSLSSTGFYRTPGISWDWKTRTGNPFNYLSLGAACSVVEIDCLTGDHKVLKTDIVMDVGASLNPAIDIGQIEGAFMQGYGLFTLEEQRFSPQGFLYTRGPGAYKIPGFGDTPAEFNVALLKGENNPRAVYSSKAIGEPPLFLGSSVFFAIKDAINAARADCRLKGTFQMDSPATAERIRMACQDQFTARFPAPEEGTFTPWDIRV